MRADGTPKLRIITQAMEKILQEDYMDYSEGQCLEKLYSDSDLQS